MSRPAGGPRPGPIRRASPILAGLSAVIVALGWSEAHPARPTLELVGDSAFDGGALPRGTFARHSWVIGNTGPAPLRLRTLFTSGRSGFSLWQGQDHLIAPGRRITVHLTWPIPGPASQPFANYATLRTSDPTRPEFRLRVVGTSGPAAPPRSPRHGAPVAGPRLPSTIETGFHHLAAPSVRSKGGGESG